MKHGHKEKGKKAPAKPSGKKISPPASKSSQSVQAKKRGGAAPAAAVGKGAPDGKNRGRSAPDSPSFNNAIVATAFKRAVKKFPNAFRRLTD
ncbi:MAG: hypothetical protein M3041_02375 [Acidobacteriota bacterium]|nr:hypothetical protein [Acidobacteriota bacterium]